MKQNKKMLVVEDERKLGTKYSGFDGRP